MQLDKKTVAGQLKFILPENIGAVRIQKGICEKEIRNHYYPAESRMKNIIAGKMQNPFYPRIKCSSLQIIHARIVHAGSVRIHANTIFFPIPHLTAESLFDAPTPMIVEEIT